MFRLNFLSIYAHVRTMPSVQSPGRGATAHLYQEQSYKCAYTCTGVLTLNTVIPLRSIQFMQSMNGIVFHLNGHITKSN
jgi:hypothetical protein